MTTLATILWAAAVVCFLIGALRSNLATVDWVSAGLGFAAAAITVERLA